MSLSIDHLSVLTLNKSFSPLGIVSLKKALRKLASGKAEVVDINEYGAYEIHDINSWIELSSIKNAIEGDKEKDWIYSGETAIEAPRIIRYTHFEKHIVNKVRLTRKNIFLRDQFQCMYCGRTFPVQKLQIEHVIPRAQGGKTTWTNTVCACKECNDYKRDRTPEQAGMTLIRKPFFPKFLPTNKNKFRWDGNRYASWKNFVSDLYWNVILTD